MSKPERVHLKLVNEKHNKEYRASLEQTALGWMVNYAYGSIGSPLKEGTKTAVPLEYEKAKAVYDRLVADKAGKACSCCGGIYASTTGALNGHSSHLQPVAQCATTKVVPMPTRGKTNAPTEFFPELLTAVDVLDAERFLNDAKYGLMRKYDGHRMAILFADGTVTAFNRLGKRIPAPYGLAEEVTKLAEWSEVKTLMLDGEYLGGKFVAFDLLYCDGNTKALPFLDRWEILLGIVSKPPQGTEIGLASLLTGRDDKVRFFLAEHDSNGEGVVLKRLDKPYMPGRQGSSIKIKFWKSATVRIARKQKTTEHHSFGTEVLKDGRQWVYTGSVTCKGPLPQVGTYREIKYLYLGVGGHLYQPEDLGARTDVTDADCKIEQLKIKQSREELVK